MMIDPQKCYDTLVKTAKALPSEEPGEWHHIIPRSLHRWRPFTFGVNDPCNLVYLSHRQHMRAHYLLWEMYKDNKMMAPRMANAYCLMADTREMVKPTPKMLDAYNEAKIAVSKAMSGEGNPMHGRTGEKHPMYGITGEKHPSYGKPKPEGAGCPSKPVINTSTGEVWESRNECARALGVGVTTIFNRIDRKSFGGVWRYLEDYEKENENGKRS